METERICPSCGRPLAAGAPQGLCPECLMKAGFGTGVAPEPGEPTSQPPFTPPPLAEMAKLFPQLEIVELLGRGGMGAVYKARQPAIDRWVALKVLPPQSTARPGFTERFNREARALARLNHPNIVALYEFGQVGGMPYFVMEYVEGVTLRRLAQARRLDPREALKIVPQICEALQFAHDEGVVHRDIKPENILLDKKGRVKIADFGIAKIMGGEGRAGSPLPADATQPEGGAHGRTRPATALTQEQVLGTPNYMAPEQVEHPQTVDHRADIYSLGVVFYEMLTGELPLGRFAPPSKKVQVDVRLDEIVLHALEKEPELRYQQASQVKTALETIAGGKSGPAEYAAIPQPIPAPATQTTSDKTILPVFLLAFFFGVFGAHRFYVGKTGTAVLQLVTFGACGIWAMIDWILILCKAFTDGQGRRIIHWTHPDVGSSAIANSGQPASGVEPPPVTEARTFAEAKGKIVAPAVGLLVAGGLKLFTTFAVPFALISLGPFFSQVRAVTGSQLFFAKSADIGLLIAAVTLVPTLLVLLGAVKMMQLRSYAWAITAAILAIVFPPWHLVGIPMGIWALVVLTQHDVREVFGKAHLLPPEAGEPKRGGVAWKAAVAVMIVAVIALGGLLWARYHSARNGGLDRPRTAEAAVDLGNGIKMEFVLIPARSFMMGSDFADEAPAHKVTLTKPFYLGKFEVTQEQWESVMESDPNGIKVSKLPVANVSWDDAQSFLKRLREKTGRKFALPTEAQWEYACRAGTRTAYSFGDGEADLEEYAWFADNSDNTTHPVGEKKPNPWGLYDMHGNVWERCADGFGPYRAGRATDPKASSSDGFHIIRGGCWTNQANGLRCSNRNSDSRGAARVGLRCVMLVEGTTGSTEPLKLEDSQPSSSYAVGQSAATASRKLEGSHRKFVRVVLDKAAMTFEGQPTTWDEVGALLEKVTDRTNTVLECAVTSDQITVQQQNEWSVRCVTLAQPLGFEYVSFIGVHPLGSKGTPGPDGVTPSPAGTLIFSPVIERVVYDISTGSNCFLNFETRELLAPTRKFIDAEDMRVWVEQHGADLGADDSRSPVGERALTFLGGCATGAESWYRATAESVVKAAQEAEAKVTEIPDRLPITVITAPTNSTASFVFKTRRGRMGLLQITGFTENPSGVEIRYKLVHTETPNQSSMGDSLGSETSPELADDTQMRADIEKDIPLAEALRRANQQFPDTQPLTEEEVMAAVRNIRQKHPDIPEDFYKTYQRVVSEQVLPRGMYFSQIRGWQTELGHFDVDWKDLTLITLPVGSEGPCFNYRIRARFISSEPLSEAEAEALQERFKAAEQASRSDKIARTPKKSAASEQRLSFGPVIERVVNDISTGRDCFLNLETGKVLTPAEKLTGWEEMLAWAQQHDADVVADEVGYAGGQRGLTLFGGFAAESYNWDQLWKAEFVLQVASGIGPRPTIGAEPCPFSKMPAATNAAPTFVFKTRQGRTGILQILGFTDNPRGVKIRYKLVQPAAGGFATSKPKATTDQVIVEDLALQMLAAIRDKDDATLKLLATDSMKTGWRDALPQFALEMRERFQQMTGKPFAMQAAESLAKDDLAVVKCTGPAELNGVYLVLFFVKTDDGWRNHSLRNSPPSVSLSRHLAEFQSRAVQTKR